MYSINQVQQLQTNPQYLEQEENRYCLISLIGKQLTNKDVENQCNFTILQIIRALQNNNIDKHKANTLINTLETYEYTTNMLGPEKTIQKINKEIIETHLNTPYFNSLCIECEDLYDHVK